MDLFEPFEKLKLKNRAVMAPMTRYFCTEDGNPTKEIINYYTKRAKNDVGLIIVEKALPLITPTSYGLLLNGAQFHSKEHSLNWKPLVDEIHNQNAKVWIQLFHAGYRLTVEEVTKTTKF